MEQIKMVSSFESYAAGIDAYSLQRIASLLGVKSPSKYRKADLIAALRETLVNDKAQLKMFSRYSGKTYKQFKYFMQVLKHFEEMLGLSHAISDELERLWACYLEDVSARGNYGE